MSEPISRTGRPRVFDSVLAVAILAVLLRISAQVALGFFDHPETWEEGTIAADLAAGRGYGYEQLGAWQQAFRAPAYPLLLGAFYALLGTDALVAGALNAGLGAGTAAAAALLGRRIGPWPAGPLAGIGVAGHPGLLVYSAKIHQLNLDALLMTLAGLLVVTALRSPTMRLAIATGLVGGVLALSRPTALPFIGFASVYVPLRSHVVTSVRWSVLVLLLTLAIASGWVARNWVVIGEATLTTSTGLAMWTGHNRSATGGAALLDGRAMWYADPELLGRVFGQDEVTQDRIFREAAAAYILDDPGRTAYNVVLNFGAFWWFGPAAGLNYPQGWLLAYAGYYVILLALAAAGVEWMLRHGRGGELVVLGMLAIVVAATQALFYVEGRHRWAIEPLVIAAAAVGGAVLASRASQR